MKNLVKTAIVPTMLLFANKIALAAAKCTLNGQEVPCGEVSGQIKSLLGLGIGFFALMAAIGIGTFIFWILMIIHAASNQIENKAMWVILMVFAGFIGALIYYFVVKRKFNNQVPTPPPAMPPTTPPTPPPIAPPTMNQ